MLDSSKVDLARKCLQTTEYEKIGRDPRKICGNSFYQSRAFLLVPFIEEVISYPSSTTPDHHKLLFILEKTMLEQGLKPNKNYDFYVDQFKSRANLD